MKMIDVKFHGARRYTVVKPSRKCPAFAIIDNKNGKIIRPFMVRLEIPPAELYAFYDRRDAWQFLREADAQDSEKARVEKFTATAQISIIRKTVAVIELFRHQNDFPDAAIAVKFAGKPQPTLIRGTQKGRLLKELIEQERRGGTIVGIVTEHDLVTLPVDAPELPMPQITQ